MKCSVQVALLPHRLTWSAFVGEWAPCVIVVVVVFVPKGPGDWTPVLPGNKVNYVSTVSRGAGL